LHDSITFEQSGRRSVVICTSPFIVTSKKIARTMGLPDYPFVVIDHPLGSLEKDELELRAVAAYEQALGVFTA